eukprot:bmy_09502T0
MHDREIPLTLLVLMFISTSEETCTSRLHITAVEGEPFYLKYCSSSSEHENKTATIKWYKNESHGPLELSLSSSPRIILLDYVLEFWPVHLNDSGSYSIRMGNDTHDWKLNVIRRPKHSCFTEKQIMSKSVEVKKSLQVACEHGYYQKLVNRTLLYKNCEKIENNQNPFLKKNAEFKDQGYYTCMFFLLHNGKLFNVTKTFNITIVGDNSNIIPALLGPKLTHVKVELGKEVQLNCSALLNEKDVIYWNIWKKNGKDPNVHEEEGTRIRVMAEDAGEISLIFPIFFFFLEDPVDIPGHIFTRGMIVTVLISVVIVCLVTVGAIYRVDLVLFYRHFLGRDETLTDGKTYDAFVSYLKECRPENGEEHTFAVEILPRVLEKHFGYKLCIFERDVVPGTAVVDEIHSLIEKSRRLIIVLSKSYMSNEVRYELESGLHEALVERKIKIILIEFTPVSDFTFLPQSLKLLKSHRVLKWQADKSLSYNSRFWKDLLYLMPAKALKPCRDEAEVLPVFSQP